jgi:translation elongation factor P/translation initiation factor 5A
VRIIASSVRKGNVLEIDDKLYVVLSAESFFPARARRRRRSTCAGSATA